MTPIEGDRPERRKDAYAELEQKFDDHMEVIEKRQRKFFVWALLAFAVIGITSAIALFGFSLVLGRIQDTREEFILDACLAQNGRHDNTITQLMKVTRSAEKKAKTKAQKTRIRQSIGSTILLINALTPKQDCAQLVKVARGEAEPPPPKSKTKKPKKRSSP